MITIIIAATKNTADRFFVISFTKFSIANRVHLKLCFYIFRLLFLLERETRLNVNGRLVRHEDLGSRFL